MHVETYPAFLTPRDEKPSLSSSEEKSSEFGQLEIKRNENERDGKTEQGSVYSIYLYIYIYIGLHDSISPRTSSRELYIKKITKQNI